MSYCATCDDRSYVEVDVPRAGEIVAERRACPHHQTPAERS